jgi:hypothetical protein
MPGDPKECRQHAMNCLQLAETASNAEANHWTRFAVELEGAQRFLDAIDGVEPELEQEARPRRSA